jgi:hypothetical protein
LAWRCGTWSKILAIVLSLVTAGTDFILAFGPATLVVE